MKREISKNQLTTHMAGIIPVSGQSLDFNFPWHDCMIPIAQNFLAIERSVIECATAGCKTIWIVCPNPIQPLLKARLGDYIQDPHFLKQSIYKLNPSQHRKLVPIYYVPAHPKDKNKRDSLVWSILYGAKIARQISVVFSKWLAPSHYYIALPYSVWPSQYLLKHRKQINDSKLTLLKFNGKSIKDGEYLSCALSYEHILSLTKEFRSKATGEWHSTSTCDDKHLISSNPMHLLTRLKRLPIEQRYSGRFLSIKDIFQNLDDSSAYSINAVWYHDISTWENYKNFLGSDNANKIWRPNKNLFPGAKTFNRITFDNVEIENSEEEE